MAHLSNDEKLPATLMEDVERTPQTSMDGEYASEFTPEEQRRIIHRIDRRLVVTVGILYCVSLMDRTNLAQAAIAGMNKELFLTFPWPSGSTVSRYSVVTLVFFTTYIVFQPPSTVIVRKIGPRIHLAGITVAWGTVMIGMAFVKEWRTLAGLRVILGVFEAGFFPSSVYLLSTWYTRYDVGKRYSVFYMLGSVATAFAGILSYGIMQLNGKAGLTGWRWIFLLEGIATVLLGCVGYVTLVDFPDKAHRSWNFLSEREVNFIIERVNKDRGDANVEPFSAAKFFRAGTDIKIWAYAMMFFNTTTVTYALAYFLPIILQENLKFNIAKSQCLAAPPYVLAAIVMYSTGWWGDKFKLRGPTIAFNMLLCIIGLPILGFSSNSAARYFGVFITTAGVNANIPSVMSYQANNIRGQWKRAFCSATLVGFGGIGGIAGSMVFRTQDKPNYRPGIYACLACCLLNLVILGLTTLAFKRQNAKADRGEVELEADSEGYQKGFRYTL